MRAEGYVYDRAPMLVYWETTLACGLACRHCRATAQAERNPLELTTEEGYRLLDEVIKFGRPYPHVVFTGGDPLNRPDLHELVRAATERGIGASLAPAATPLLTQEVMESLRDAGIQNISLSLDGSDAARHDGFRMVAGTFDKTLQAARWARAAGLPIQVNTLVTDETLEDLPAVYELLLGMDIMRWSLFMLITTGRGSALREVTPAQSEKLNAWLFGLSKTAPFQVKTTEATHYRRLAIRDDGGRRDGLRGDPRDVRRPRVRHPGRQRDRVRQPRRDGEPVGLPADPAGQRARGVHRGPVPRPPGDARTCAGPRASRAAAAPASTRGSAAAPGPGPTRGPATRSSPTRCARTCRRAPWPSTGCPPRRRRPMPAVTGAGA